MGLRKQQWTQNSKVQSNFHITTIKNEILYSAKLAMHLCMDKFVMADFDIEEGQELEVSDLFLYNIP